MTTEKGRPRHPAGRDRGGTERGCCPPHGPLMVSAIEKGVYVTSCLVCGAMGPQRNDGWEAKLAFDEALQPPE